MLGKIFITRIGMINTVGRNGEEVLYSLKNAKVWCGLTK
jgi:hypothetical protein